MNKLTRTSEALGLLKFICSQGHTKIVIIGVYLS